ncbi:MAG: hypothetical protein WD740_07770 [Anaerolineales bacterium]
MEIASQTPDRERLSAVMAVILLAFVVSRFVQLPGQTIGLEIAGIYLPLQLDINTPVALLVAGLTATGTDWILQTEANAGSRSRYRHWLLPAMTAWVLSLPLASMPLNIEWWLALMLCAFFLLAVMLAEFASSTSDNRYYSLATQALTILTLGLFLILAITMRAVALRLYLVLPALGLGVLLAASRLQLLRLGQKWQPLQIVGITFICLQVAAALHYLPLSALGYGLALLGVLYAFNHYLGALNSEEPAAQAVRQSLVSLAVFWALALLLGQ